MDSGYGMDKSFLSTDEAISNYNSSSCLSSSSSSSSSSSDDDDRVEMISHTDDHMFHYSSSSDDQNSESLCPPIILASAHSRKINSNTPTKSSNSRKNSVHHSPQSLSRNLIKKSIGGASNFASTHDEALEPGQDASSATTTKHVHRNHCSSGSRSCRSRRHGCIKMHQLKFTCNNATTSTSSSNIATTLDCGTSRCSTETASTSASIASETPHSQRIYKSISLQNDSASLPRTTMSNHSPPSSRTFNKDGSSTTKTPIFRSFLSDDLLLMRFKHCRLPFTTYRSTSMTTQLSPSLVSSEANISTSPLSSTFQNSDVKISASYPLSSAFANSETNATKDASNHVSNVLENSKAKVIAANKSSRLKPLSKLSPVTSDSPTLYNSPPATHQKPLPSSLLTVPPNWCKYRKSKGSSSHTPFQRHSTPISPSSSSQSQPLTPPSTPPLLSLLSPPPASPPPSPPLSPITSTPASRAHSRTHSRSLLLLRRHRTHKKGKFLEDLRKARSKFRGQELSNVSANKLI